MNEVRLYPDIVKWLKSYLKDRHSHSEIQVYDTHKINLSRFIVDQKLHKFFSEYNAFEIKVDITAIIRAKKRISLAFVECKVKPITLRDVGQILGYSLVAKPEYAFIVSPEGISDSLNALFRSFGRYDILEYAPGRKIRIVQWDLTRKEIDSRTLLPPGEFIPSK